MFLHTIIDFFLFCGTVHYTTSKVFLQYSVKSENFLQVKVCFITGLDYQVWSKNLVQEFS